MRWAFSVETGFSNFSMAKNRLVYISKKVLLFWKRAFEADSSLKMVKKFVLLASVVWKAMNINKD